MKKYLVFILIFLSSCQKDDMFIGPEEPIYEMIFESPVSKVVDGQDISFKIINEGKHWLLIIDEQTQSVISKESFLPTIGLNTRKIYTKSLPKKTLKLILQNEADILNSTSIIVE